MLFLGTLIQTLIIVLLITATALAAIFLGRYLKARKVSKDKNQ